MADMNKLQMLNIVRDFLREKLGSGQSSGNWNNATLFRYIDQGLWDAYWDEIDADKTRFNVTSALTSDGTEFFTLPTDYVRHKLLLKTSDIGNHLRFPYTEISPDDRNNWQDATDTGRAFYFYTATQIGVLPLVTSGETLTLTYFKKFAELDDAGVAKSDLHDLAQYLVCLYAARSAFVDRGDGNANAIQSLINDRREKLHNIRRSSQEPFHLVAR